MHTPLRLAATATILTTLLVSLSAWCGENAPAARLNLVPWPRTLTEGTGALTLAREARIAAEAPALRPTAAALAEELAALTGMTLLVVDGQARAGDIGLRLDARLSGEAYAVRIEDRALIEAGNRDAAALGVATLLQLATRAGATMAFPRVAIEDAPFAAYRGLLIDVARRYHPIETLKQCVILCHLYKIRYLQLHLTDDQSFTFPSTAFPLLTTKNDHGGPSYTLKELRDLEEFAAARGVAIIPELEVPGHAATMNRTMPDLFKIKGTQPYEHHATINFANERVLAALDTLVGEMCAVFRTTPYFHIGGDEADFEFAHQHPDFQAAFARHGLGDKGQRQLYRLFLIQMNDIVKKHGKRMLVWEGFHPDPASKFPIPADVTIMEYECPFYPPEQLVADGRTFINAAWTPLYLVNGHQWSPAKIYAWNLYRLGQFGNNWATIAWHQLAPTPLVIGAQMCAWEQPAHMEIASLRTRLSAMSERIWNPDLGRTYEDFAQRSAAVDALLSALIPSIAFEAKGLAVPHENALDQKIFNEAVELTLRAEGRGAAEIRYTLDGQEPARTTTSAHTYTGPLTFRATTTVRAAAFDGAGAPIGHETSATFYLQPKLEPNLATGKPVTASSGTQLPQKPEFAVDGKIDEPHDSWWAGPPPQWLQVDLGSACATDRIQVFPFWDGSRYYQYIVEASLDGKTWKLLGDKRANTTPATPQGDEFTFPVENTRYVRVTMLKNSANEGVHLVELMVHAPKKG
jgi:hexosaminidase